MAVATQSLLLLAVALFVCGPSACFVKGEEHASRKMMSVSQDSTVAVADAAVVQAYGSRKLMGVAEDNTIVAADAAVDAKSLDATPNHSRKMLQYWGWGWWDNGYDNGYDDHKSGWYRNGGECQNKTKKYGGWCKNKKGCKICTCSWWYYSYTWRGDCSKWAEWY